jgi:acetyl esterase
LHKGFRLQASAFGLREQRFVLKPEACSLKPDFVVELRPMRRTILSALAILLAGAAMATAGIIPDIEYGKAGSVSLRLDAYVPDGRGPFATVIIVHGGSWRNGDKQTFVKPLFEPLTKAGFAWFTINYRLAPDYVYPAAVDDVVQAVQFVKAHARQYKVNTRKIALMGESAGGHLVALVGARDGRKLGLAAVVPFYAPCDFRVLAAAADRNARAPSAIFTFLGIKGPGPEAERLLAEASPATYVSKHLPPFLLIHGDADPTVPYAQSVKMQELMQKAGARCELFTVHGGAHGVGGWEKDPALQAYKQKMVEWLKATMGR